MLVATGQCLDRDFVYVLSILFQGHPCGAVSSAAWVVLDTLNAVAVMRCVDAQQSLATSAHACVKLLSHKLLASQQDRFGVTISLQ